MTLSKYPTLRSFSNVFLKGEELQIVHEFKYLVVNIDSTLSFKNHVKNIDFSFHTISQIRSSLPENAARPFFHTMIFFLILNTASPSGHWQT